MWQSVAYTVQAISAEWSKKMICGMNTKKKIVENGRTYYKWEGAFSSYDARNYDHIYRNGSHYVAERRVAGTISKVIYLVRVAENIFSFIQRRRGKTDTETFIGDEEVSVEFRKEEDGNTKACDMQENEKEE